MSLVLLGIAMPLTLAMLLGFFSTLIDTDQAKLKKRTNLILVTLTLYVAAAVMKYFGL